MPSKLGYWKVRGFAQPIRYLLGYVGEDFEEVLYEVGEGPEFNKDEWFSVKYTLGFDFPNIPYYIDEEVKLTQSYTILRYLARKYNLYGDTLKEKAHIDLLFDVFLDIRQAFVQLCYGADFNEKRSAYIEKTKETLATVEKYLGDKKFFIGDKITVIDFNIYEILDHQRVLEPTMYDNLPKLRAFLKRFEDIPANKKFMNSPRCFKGKINNKMASFQ